MPSDPPHSTLPVSDAARVESLGAEFERAWLSESPPRIENYLGRVPANLQPAAFAALLAVDIKVRFRRQESVNPDDYLGRFAIHASAIRRVFCETQIASDAVASDPRDPRSGLQVRCPHCHNPVDLALDAELESILCASCGSDFSLTTDDDEATRDARSLAQVGHFKLVERLGLGAFGAVWKAQDTELDRTVAIKIPRAGQLDKHRQELFLREARSAAQLRHPNIVPVYEVGREGDTLYIVSEFIRGTTLSDRLTAGPMGAHEAVDLCATIAGALHHAHEQKVIHRDLKPANILVDDQGRPHLTDFGLARREAGDVTMTLHGQVLGTPAYMSPEQAQGESHVADRRSDVYSLGVILYELLTGELPFRGNVRMLIYQAVHDEPPPPRLLNSSIPRDLEVVVLKCLEKQPHRRYDSAQAVADELQRLLAGEPIHARPPTRLGRVLRWYQRNTEAVVYTAGGFSMVTSAFLLTWVSLGLVYTAFGVIEPPGNGTLELVFLALFFFPMMFFTGIYTINHSVVGLALGAAVFCGWTTVYALATLQVEFLLLKFDVMGAAYDLPYYRYQVVSLFLMFSACGAILHLLALGVVARRALSSRKFGGASKRGPKDPSHKRR